MSGIHLPSSSGSTPPRSSSPAPQLKTGKPVADPPSPREIVWADARSSLASSDGSEFASFFSSDTAFPHFEKRCAPAPELPRISAWVDKRNRDPRSSKTVLDDLRYAKARFTNRIQESKQTMGYESAVSAQLMVPILRSENARTPGLNAVACRNANELGKALQTLSKAVGRNREGHVRFHFGVDEDIHRVAVDAFRHRQGGFTLIVVDSVKRHQGTLNELEILSQNFPGLIKGVLVIPSPNLLHDEGCRIFAVHHLNALHDYQPYVESLHRQLYDKGQGRPAPLLSGPEWVKNGDQENSHVLADAKDAFSVLPGKFFKHMQVPRTRTGSRTLLDDAEDRNPALKDQAVNKQGQTLRERFASLNPAIPPEYFSRAHRTLSADKKRIVLIDRAIEYYEGRAAKPKSLPRRFIEGMLRHR